MINNLQIELKRRKLEQEFYILQREDNLSQQDNDSNTNSPLTANYPRVTLGCDTPTIHSGVRERLEDTSLELKTTNNPTIMQGTKSNGVKYSVRTDRLRFFFPNEWKLFIDNLETERQRISLDILINTGARINETRHIKKEDIDFNRGTLTIKKAKIKAKKGERFPKPRTFKLSSQFTERLKEYTKELKDDEFIPVLTDSALNLAMKKILKRIGIKDYQMISVHNIRKTHGNWLVAHDFNIANICKRLGHDMNTFLGSYASADIFNDNDRIEIKEILGDLING